MQNMLENREKEGKNKKSAPNFGQKLTEDEVKAYIPNRNLELTMQAEIKRLQRVIAEKDECISKFKKYDKERTAYCHRLEQNYSMMEEQYTEWCGIIDEENGKASSSKFNKLRRDYASKKQKAETYMSSIDNVKQTLQNLTAMLREMLAFAIENDDMNGEYYKRKIKSAMQNVDNIMMKIVSCKNKYNLINEKTV